MGKRGPRPEPTAIKVLKGNPGKRPLNKAEPAPQKAIPKCPENLHRLAKKEWKRLAPILFDLGLLTEIDGTALELYCAHYATYVEASQMLQEEGLVVPTYSNTKPQYNDREAKYDPPTQTGVKQNPHLLIAHKAMAEMRRSLAEFGMTPSSRSRIPSIPKDKSNESDGWADLLPKK